MKRIISLFAVLLIVFSAVFAGGTSALADSAEDLLGVSLTSTLGAQADAAARSIVAAAAGMSDYDKLAYYLIWIDTNNAYNYDAAASGTRGDAAHAAWVFDGDPSTKTTCWGYSRAFQYLCDLTAFSSSAIRCYTVIGRMNGSAHVWNVVHMDDGRNYLVDTVNCDATLSDELHAAAYPDQVFLHGYTSGSLSGGYTFSAFGGYYTLTYVPGTNSLNTLGSSILTLSSATYAGAPQGTWSHSGNKWYYNVNGSPVKGWKKIGGLWFYFDPSTGVMKTGWRDIGGSRYYLDPNTGIMQTGTVTIDGQTYYFDAGGRLSTQAGSGDETEQILTGWQKQNGSWYYYDTDGTACTGWKKVGGAWYYLNESGVMQTGWVKVGGVWYYLNANGAMVTGWLKLNGTWYYLRSSGAMATGWVKVGGTWYYMNSSGAMMTGWVRVGGSWYYLQSSGAMKTGWLKSGSTWYYLQSSGAMAADTTLNIGGTDYTFNASGAWQASAG